MSVTHERDGRRNAPWLLFIFQLPARKASARVSVWRKLQKYGALAWKNAAYILPYTSGNLEKFQWLAVEVAKHRGEASIAQVARLEGQTDRQIIALFNDARERDYEGLVGEIRFALRPSGRRGKSDRRDGLSRLNRRMSEIVAVDFFGCAKRKEAEKMMKELEAQSRRASAEAAPLRAQEASEYQRKVWMTRPKPEVDRVASAWLIKRFIDRKARFVFSPNPQAHPGAVRFDMFEGEFTHVGDNCTFETLLKFFDLRDKRLRMIAQAVHDADLEDSKFGRPEGRAIDLILKGWAKMNWPDTRILSEGFDLYNALYTVLVQ